MKTFNGYKKKNLTDSNLLLAGSGHKPLNELLTDLSRPTNTNKISITVGGNTLQLDLGARAWDSTAYLPLSGGTVTGPIEISTGATNNSYNEGLRLTRANNSWAGITFGSTGLSGAPTGGWFVATNPSNQFIINPDDSGNTAGLQLNKGGDLKWRNIVVSLNGHTHNFSDFNYPNNTGKFLRGDGNWSNVLNSNLDIFPAPGGNYGDGIRIHSRDNNNDWCSITFCASDNTGTGSSGITSNSWYLGVSNGDFFIGKGATGSGSEHHLRSVNQAWECSGTWQ